MPDMPSTDCTSEKGFSVTDDDQYTYENQTNQFLCVSLLLSTLRKFCVYLKEVDFKVGF